MTRAVLHLLHEPRGDLKSLDSVMAGKAGNRSLVAKSITANGFYQAREEQIRQREQATKLLGPDKAKLQAMLESKDALNWELVKRLATQIPLWQDRLPEGQSTCDLVSSLFFLPP